jgi:hypothetical protein
MSSEADQCQYGYVLHAHPLTAAHPTVKRGRTIGRASPDHAWFAVQRAHGQSTSSRPCGFEHAIDFDGLFATAGSKQRRQLLRDTSIAHVYGSSSLEFADLTCGDIEGYGVDTAIEMTLVSYLATPAFGVATPCHLGFSRPGKPESVHGTAFLAGLPSRRMTVSASRTAVLNAR